MSRAVSGATAARPDRQERLRARIGEVEALLGAANDGHEVRLQEFLRAQTELAERRRLLAQAELAHGKAVERLADAKAQRDEVAGELSSLQRRLEMSELVRRNRV